MSLMEQIQNQVRKLPVEKQSEVLNFITFLQQRTATQLPAKKRSLKRHPAYGSWRGRKIDALQYQQTLRAEWDH